MTAGSAVAVTRNQELVARAAGRGVEAFAELVRAQQAAAFGAAVALLRDFQLVQDATQEAFAAAYFGLSQLCSRATLAVWLRGIVRHPCRSIQRRRGESLLDESLALTLEAPRALPEALRAPVRLSFVEDRTQREVAAIFGLPVTTVNNRLHAARWRLHEKRPAMMCAGTRLPSSRNSRLSISDW